MRVGIKVTGISQLERKLRAFAHENPKVSVPVFNRAATRAATAVRRDVAKRAELPVKVFKERVQAFKGSAKARRGTKGRESYVWIGTARSIRLDTLLGGSFNIRSSTLKVGRSKTKVFRARMPNGYRGLFVRKPNSSHKRRGRLIQRADGQRTELPIDSPKARIDVPHAQQQARARVEEQLKSYVPRELKRLMNRKVKQLARRA